MNQGDLTVEIFGSKNDLSQLQRLYDFLLFNFLNFFSTINDSIRYELKKSFFEKFEILKKNSKSQVTWHHNGQKYFFRFFGLRMTQFEKINEKKNSKIFIFFRKNSKSQVTWPGNGKFGIKIFFIAFLESEWFNS